MLNKGRASSVVNGVYNTRRGRAFVRLTVLQPFLCVLRLLLCQRTFVCRRLHLHQCQDVHAPTHGRTDAIAAINTQNRTASPYPSSIWSTSPKLNEEKVGFAGECGSWNPGTNKLSSCIFGVIGVRLPPPLC